jgi:hypothetical protein
LYECVRVHAYRNKIRARLKLALRKSRTKNSGVPAIFRPVSRRGGSAFSTGETKKIGLGGDLAKTFYEIAILTGADDKDRYKSCSFVLRPSGVLHIEFFY